MDPFASSTASAARRPASALSNWSSAASAAAQPPMPNDIRLRYSFYSAAAQTQAASLFEEQHKWLSGHLEDVFAQLDKKRKRTDLADLIKTPSRKRAQQKQNQQPPAGNLTRALAAAAAPPTVLAPLPSARCPPTSASSISSTSANTRAKPSKIPTSPRQRTASNRSASCQKENSEDGERANSGPRLPSRSAAQTPPPPQPSTPLRLGSPSGRARSPLASGAQPVGFVTFAAPDEEAHKQKDRDNAGNTQRIREGKKPEEMREEEVDQQLMAAVQEASRGFEASSQVAADEPTLATEGEEDEERGESGGEEEGENEDEGEEEEEEEGEEDDEQGLDRTEAPHELSAIQEGEEDEEIGEEEEGGGEGEEGGEEKSEEEEEENGGEAVEYENEGVEPDQSHNRVETQPEPEAHQLQEHVEEALIVKEAIVTEPADEGLSPIQPAEDPNAEANTEQTQGEQEAEETSEAGDMTSLPVPTQPATAPSSEPPNPPPSHPASDQAPALGSDRDVAVPLNDNPSTLRNLHSSLPTSAGAPQLHRTPTSASTGGSIFPSSHRPLAPHTAGKASLPPSPSSLFLKSSHKGSQAHTLKLGGPGAGVHPSGFNLGAGASTVGLARPLAGRTGPFDGPYHASASTLGGSQESAHQDTWYSVASQASAAGPRGSLKRPSLGLSGPEGPSKVAKLATNGGKLESVKEALNKMRQQRESALGAAARASVAPRAPPPAYSSAGASIAPASVAFSAPAAPTPSAQVGVQEPQRISALPARISQPGAMPRKRSSVGDLVARFETKGACGGEAQADRLSGSKSKSRSKSSEKKGPETASPPRVLDLASKAKREKEREVSEVPKQKLKPKPEPEPEPELEPEPEPESEPELDEEDTETKPIAVESTTPRASPPRTLAKINLFKSRVPPIAAFDEFGEVDESMGYGDGMVIEEEVSSVYQGDGNTDAGKEEDEYEDEDGEAETREVKIGAEFFDAREEGPRNSNDKTKERDESDGEREDGGEGESEGEVEGESDDADPDEDEDETEAVQASLVHASVSFEPEPVSLPVQDKGKSRAMDPPSQTSETHRQPALKKTPSTLSLNSTKSQQGGLSGLLSKAGTVLSTSWGVSKAVKPEVKSLQLAAAVAKKEQEDRERKAAQREEREQRRLVALEKKQAEDRQKAEEEKRARAAELERRKREREELLKKSAAKPKPTISRQTSEEPAKKRKAEPESRVVDPKKPKAQPDQIPGRVPSAASNTLKSSTGSNFQPVRPAPPIPTQNKPSTKPANDNIRIVVPTATGKAGGSLAGPSRIPSGKKPQVNLGGPPTAHAPNQTSQSSHAPVPRPSSSRAPRQLQQPQENSDVYVELPDIDSEYSDDDEDERAKKEKELPLWCRSPHLRNALKSQSQIDGAQLFGPIAGVEMEELFKGKTGRFRKRTSSANWSGPDGLTATEEAEYALRMGFKRGGNPQT